MRRVDQLVAEESWDTGIVNDLYGEVLRSANDLFGDIKKNLKRTAALTRGQPLVDLHRAFGRVLQAYAQRLGARIPRPQAGLAARPQLGNADWQLRLREEDYVLVSLIANTGNYCKRLAEDLAGTMARTLEGVPNGAEQMDASQEADVFVTLVSSGVAAVVLGCETALEPGLLSLTRRNWTDVEIVGDQSDYVTLFGSVLGQTAAVVGRVLSESDFRFFVDKVVDSFLPRYTVSSSRKVGLDGSLPPAPEHVLFPRRRMPCTDASGCPRPACSSCSWTPSPSRAFCWSCRPWAGGQATAATAGWSTGACPRWRGS